MASTSPLASPGDAGPPPPPPRPIAQLPAAAAHRVAAGQAVLDLAGAVKELVENALDEGATSVRLTESGSELIEVADNGRGVAPADRAALARKHTTSKLASFEELEGVSTFGFRGEALSSLCALAEGVSVVTRTAGEAAGARLTYDAAGELAASEAAARAPGTTVAVRRLFAPLPVRRRELARTLRREYGRALALLQAYALRCTGARMVVTNQTGSGPRTTALATQAGASVLANFGALFGAKAAAGLVPLAFDLPGGGTASGYVSSASAERSRAGGERQFFFVNGRPVEFPRAARVLNDAYRALGSPATAACRPAAFLDFSIPSGRWDVNSAPDKRRVMLAGEDAVVTALDGALRELWEPSRCAFAVAGALLPAKRGRRADGGRAKERGEAEATEGESESDGDDDDASQASPSAPPAGRGRRGGRGGGPSPTAPSPRPRTEMGRELERFALRARYAPAPVAAPASAPAAPGGPLPRPGRGDRAGRDQPTLAQYVVRTAAPSPKRARSGAAAGGRAAVEGETTPEAAPETAPQHEAPPVTVDGERAAAAASLPRGTAAMDVDGEEARAAGPRAQVPPAPVPAVARLPSSPEVALVVQSQETASLADQSDRAPVAVAQLVAPPPSPPRGSRLGQSPTRAAAPSPERAASPEGHPSGAAFTVDVDVDALERQFQARWAEADAREVVAPDAPNAPPVAADVRAAFAAASLMDADAGDGDAREATQQRPAWLPGPDVSGADAPLPLAPDAPDAAGAELERCFDRAEFIPLAAGVLGQFNHAFILARLGDDLWVVDQHAADEKANFERLEAEAEVGKQPLLVPQALGLAPSEVNVVRDHLDAFRANGFDFVDSPAGDLLLAAVPTVCGTLLGVGDVRELAAALAHPGAAAGGVVPRPPRLRAALAMRACRSSIMAGRPLSRPEMQRVVARLATLVSPWNCPHGRPTMRHLAVLPAADEGAAA